MEYQLNNELFKALSNTSDNVYIFENDMKTGISHWSDNAVTYFALPPSYTTDTLNVWLKKIHPDDRKSYLDDVDAVFAGKKDRHCVQYRVQSRYGDYVWVECTGNVVLDADGVPSLFAGMITRLDNQSKYDPLTKLLSVHQFYLQDSMKEPAVLLLLGMDDFRRVIHTYGYEVGDEILCIMAEELDFKADQKRIYRMYGDEFLVVLPNGSEKKARRYFHAVKARFRRRMEALDFTKLISFSGSGSVYVPGECDKETLMKRLEHSMEQAKSNGPGKLVFFTKELEQRHIKRYEISKELEWSINHNFEGFTLYYQPVQTNADGVIRTVEALLRFHSNRLGAVSPEEFIPILESSRTIRQVGTWVMEQAVAQCRRWNEVYDQICVGFNVSYLQLYNENFIKKLIETVEREKVDSHLIAIELTESCKVLYPENLAVMFQKLLDYGFRVALDDFGMEHSSLTLLRDLPVTTVKIDHSFVRTIQGGTSRTDHANLAIISGIIKMCKEMDLNVVVEGVENEQLSKIIHDMKVDFLQGYYYSRPVPEKEVEQYFQNFKGEIPV